MSFWHGLKRGPWPEEIIRRLCAALDDLTGRVREEDGVEAIILFGSYARGEFGRKSDVDLLVLVRETAERTERELRQVIVAEVVDVESHYRLPMHLAPLVSQTAALGTELLHDLWRDGVILFAVAGTLARLQPSGLSPWVIIRYSASALAPDQRVRLSRHLFGREGRPGLVTPPAVRLGKGAVLVPAGQARALGDMLDTLGVEYDTIAAWRPY